MPATKVTVNIAGKVRHRWALRLGFWLAKRCTVEILADGRRLGRQPILETAIIEEDE